MTIRAAILGLKSYGWPTHSDDSKRQSVVISASAFTSSWSPF